MAQIKAFSPPDVGTEEHIIRRLGWAVVRQWSSLPGIAKDQILGQAVYVTDKQETVQLNEQIKAFISKHSAVI